MSEDCMNDEQALIQATLFLNRNGMFTEKELLRKAGIVCRALVAQEARARKLVALVTEYLRYDGGKGSECYHAIKSYDARERLCAALAEGRGK